MFDDKIIALVQLHTTALPTTISNGCTPMAGYSLN